MLLHVPPKVDGDKSEKGQHTKGKEDDENSGSQFHDSPWFRSVEKAIPGFFNYRLAKDASANLTIFLALKDKAKFGTTSCAAPARFSTGCQGMRGTDALLRMVA
jgi:hypothetical protein